MCQDFGTNDISLMDLDELDGLDQNDEDLKLVSWRLPSFPQERWR